MTEQSSASPTVVLVHGAFADASSWNGVIELLLAAGVKVQAPANPLRGLASDSAYVAGVLNQIPGPVLAVGHSYGGAVISNAATEATNVVGLVFVAAFATDENEVLSAVEGTSRDSALGPALLTAQYPTGSGNETATELYVNPASFHDVFSARPAREPVSRSRCRSATGRGRGVRREVRYARLAQAAVLGRRRDG